MHPDDLKTIWDCQECGRRFLYNSDVIDHKQEYHHSKIVSRDLRAGKLSHAIFVRRQLSIDFKLEGETSRVTVECKYYPATQVVQYGDVRYSDAKLRSKIESDPEMMRRVDNYVRKLLEENASKGSGRF